MSGIGGEASDSGGLSRLGTSLARYGLTDPRACKVVVDLGWWRDNRPAPDAEPVVWALARTPDANLAALALERIFDAAGPAEGADLQAALRTDVGLRGRLLAVIGTSVALGDHLAADPSRWRLLITPEVPGGEPVAIPAERAHPVQIDFRARLLSTVGADPDAPPPGTPHGARATVTGPEAVRALRAAYRDLLLLLAAADLAVVAEPGLPVVHYRLVGGALADLAEAGLAASLAIAAAQLVGPDKPGEPLAARLAVIGMGKCGGRELNYVSDVDVIFAAGTEAELPAATRLASTMMRIAGEACFEVDAALRPEGKAGALVRTLDGHVAYYKRWAHTWEFQALLKARPVAGDPELGESYVDLITPMVWTAADREDFVTDVQAMRRRVENELPRQLLDRELKLGRGGLRDVEFAVQLLQLVHGRNDEELRVRSTVDALRVLGEGGYVGRDDAANLASSYRFLRTIEHRLQLRRLRRTHTMPPPEDETERRLLARAANLRPDGRRDVLAVLTGELKRHTMRVRRLHEKLFYRPLLQAVAKVPTEELVLTERSATARLGALGYRSPDSALRHLAALTSGLSRGAAIQNALLPALLAMLADTPDPDAGLLAYRRVSEALAGTPWYLRWLRDEGAVAERLMHLLGTAKMVPELMVRAPDVLRVLGDDDALAGRRDEFTPVAVAASLRAAAARHPDPGRAVAAARSIRRAELLRVGCADLLGLVTVHEVCETLTSIWVATLAAAVDAVTASVVAAAGGPRPAFRLSVVGLGRLGGRELGYGSDADVLFVAGPVEGADERTAMRQATTVAEQVRGLLGASNADPPLVVDADLRPEGRSGPLVRTMAAYRAYYKNWSLPWEAQALLRASVVAGDQDLGEELLHLIDPVRYPARGLTAAELIEVRRIKARVEKERLPRGADPSTHTKLGRGGLADVEWTAQLLQLQHAHEVPGMRTTSTLEALAAARESGLLTGQDTDALVTAWNSATRMRNALTLVRGKQTDQIPRPGRELTATAAALGYPPGADPGVAVDAYRRAGRRARAVVERVFFGS